MRVEEDYQAWEAYPEQQWVFNKMEVALKFGYDAGPAGVPIKKSGWYIIRPIYNLYGMGIGAEKKYLSVKHDADDMIHHKHIPPGHFWCTYLNGNHYSIDYRKKNSVWKPFCCMVGNHISDENLVRFEKWTKIEIPQIQLPDFIHELECEYLNIEFKGELPFEIHLRSGNDFLWDYEIGTEMYPVWDKLDYEHLKHLKFIPNFHPENFKYSADGYLKDIRLGYYVNTERS